MRFARLGPIGSERPVVEGPDGTLLDLTPLTSDLDGDFLRGGIGRVASDLHLLEPVAAQGRWGSPLTRPGKVVGIGLNYTCHAAEAGVTPPDEPVVFLKATTSVCGPHDEIRIRSGATRTDYEVELGVVIGRELRGQVSPEAALTAVAGYVLAHDVSDRELQLERGGTWTKGKSADTFCPLGPWLVTPDELDPAHHALSLSVNGRPAQQGDTSGMIFGVAHILGYLSTLMTLEPGDVVITGTPAGVAISQPEPRPYLRHGDVVELDGGVLGRQRSRVVDPSVVRERSGAR